MLSYPPHLTLRGDFEIKDENIPILISDLSDVASLQKKIVVQTSKFEFYPWKMVSLEVISNSALDNLHIMAMDTIQKYRTAWIPQVLIDNTSDYTEKQKEYIHEFGYQFAYEYFSPHFGLAGNDMTQEIFDTIKVKYHNREEKINVSLEKIALIDREKNNQPIATFSLT